MSRKKQKVYGILLILIGLFILGYGFILLFGEKPQTVMVTATVTDVRYETTTGMVTGDKQHYVYVDYSFGEQVFENVRTDSYQNEVLKGDEITISVNPSTGELMTSKRTYNFMGLLVSFFGLLFGVGGFFMIKD